MITDMFYFNYKSYLLDPSDWRCRTCMLQPVVSLRPNSWIRMTSHGRCRWRSH